MEEGRLTLKLLTDNYAVCRLHMDAPVPEWATRGPFSSVTRTADELSVVCLDSQVPAGVRRDNGWRVMMVEGPLALSLIGILASLASPLARERISIFALSTYDTDYLMVKDAKLEKTIQTLRAEGHNVDEESMGFAEEANAHLSSL